jgi:4-hydroxybenzoate polyprenyltransferase
MAEPLPRPKPLPARESVEQIVTSRTIVRGEQTRYVLALIATVSLFLLLGISLFLNPSPFQAVAAALSGPIGLIWGYYFGTKKSAKEEPEP